MKHRLMKKLALAALLVASAAPAFASQYYVVVPVPNRTATEGNILVTLSGYSLPQGQVGDVYAGFDFNSVLQVLGDPSYSPSNVRWSVAGGALPAGLTLSANGRLSGTPTAGGSSSFQVMAAYKTKAGEQTYTVMVNNLVVSLAHSALPDGEQGAAYSFDLKPKLQISGDASYTGAGVTWSLVSGSLPAGLTLGADGVITGTPTAENSGTPFTVQAKYKTRSGQQAYQVVVGAIVVSLSNATLPRGTNSEQYTFDFSPYVQVGGDAAYAGAGVTWSVVNGTLPTGLTLNSNTGVLSGKPVGTTSGTSFTVQAAYKTKAGQLAYTLVVASTPVVLAPTGFAAGGAPQAYYYEDQTVAASCKEYHAGKPGYAAAANTGYYWVNMGAGTERVYCDMTTNGGGWTLVARSGGPVVTNAVFCNSGQSGVNTPFGWSVARGSPADTSNPYSMGVFSRNLTFTEVLIGDASGTSNSWGTHVFEQAVPPSFRTALPNSDVPLSAAAFPMAQYMGHTTDTTQYFFRDVPDVDPRSPQEAYGLHADGWQTCYGDGPTSLSPQVYPASYGGNMNYRHGMLMVR
ncbi:TPA: putative Ig domain-containing protein [Burkholderia vietnamiensis]|nr:putative Ig domain-containing protein [Burkholderia vietnamiensis]